MSPLNNQKTGHRYWRSMDDLVRTPEFEAALKREFPDDEWDTLPPATRRTFLKVMGASVAFAGLTGCRWPEEEIVPFAHRPEGRVPGVPEQYATAMELGGAALGLMVTSYDGRPVKAEGNLLHPDSLGALTATAQAIILEMYDPDRSRRVFERQGGQEFTRSWADFETALPNMMSGAGVAILSQPSSSPSLAAVAQRVRNAHPSARWFEWAPINFDNESAGTEMAFGRKLRVVPQLAGASSIAAFDCDFLYSHPSSLRLTREFAAGRSTEAGQMNRLWVVEPGMSGAGAMADRRHAVKFAEVAKVLAATAVALASHHGVDFGSAAGLLHVCATAEIDEATAAFAGELAADLVSSHGRGAVLVGPRQPAEVHALAAVVNTALGFAGHGVQYVEAPATDAANIEDLVAAMNRGEVSTLLILGGNPVYDAPADLAFGEALAKVGTSIRLGLFEDETSKLCSWHLPAAHALESWGDGRAWDGTRTMMQPLIEPLYAGRSALEVLAIAAGDGGPTKGYDIVRQTSQDEVLTGAEFEKAWRTALHDGVIADSAFESAAVSLAVSGIALAEDGLAARLIAATAVTELLLAVDPKIYDGRYANNGWLQELPESLTKITWDNALIMSPPTAKDFGVKDGDVVAVNGSVELPVYVMPGPARGSMTAWLGYGRTTVGNVGNGVGANTYDLRTTDNLWVVDGPSMSPTGRTYKLATTQDHWAIDDIGFDARQSRVGILVREATVEEYKAHPEAIEHMVHHPPLISLWKEKVYEGEQWGMAIDLNACTGCNACVVACQAENNVPVVGREQVLNQREMHWIRLDRYFKTPEGVNPEEVDQAQVAFQPMTCVQCENAPCEQVCPVAATQHTEDGLNAMVYNRCVGTRYCANNCPLKVRRFNFFNYHKDLAEVSKMQFNPEVTVRSRGVMEKCSFCVQRIQKARIEAGNENRPIAESELTTACAQTCPAQAITFGNVNDPESAVSKLREDHRSYATLAELNIKPRVHYMARLRNPGGEGAEASHDDTGHGHDASHGKESA